MKFDSLTSAEWIALAACIGTFLALIPAFAQMLHNKKMKTFEIVSERTEENRPINGFGKSLILSSMALTFMIIEIILFSWVASMNGIEVNTKTMPTNWLIIFYALFVLPSLSLYLALGYFFEMFD